MGNKPSSSTAGTVGCVVAGAFNPFVAIGCGFAEAFGKKSVSSDGHGDDMITGASG